MNDIAQNTLDRLNGGLIASCQPVDNGALDTPEIICALARACIDGGANGVRIQGAKNVAFARPYIKVPIIGIIKRDLENSPIRITPFIKDIEDLANAGADIIAIDGTKRKRPVEIKELFLKIKELKKIAMADCSNIDDGLFCRDLGFDIIGTTMSGYTGEITPKEPDLALVSNLARNKCWVMAEGRYNNPALAKSAFEEGANAITIGSALTRLELMTSWFVKAIKSAETKTKQSQRPN
ncbi:MAG: N-acetylmannosamine-6-phosphate 2-epimerase [Helicobacter sp.]|nr:N-acetylmannosamine-6-phosphate 2-epimerase [Helicobacter sp.]